MAEDKIDNEQSEMSLSGYLSENKEILTILGVFVAVTALSARLDIKLVAALISFASFSCVTLIAIELWRRKPGRNRISVSNFVVYFRFFLFLLVAGFSFYWFIILYYIIDSKVIFCFSVLILTETAIFIVERLKEKKSRKLKKIFDSKLLRICFCAVLIILIFLFSGIAYRFLNSPISNIVEGVMSASNNIVGIFP